MSTDTTERIVPAMGAEAGYAVEETVPPLRFSGYVSFIFGLLSVTALIGPAALVCPLLAILFGLIALRRYDEPAPAGRIPAKIGLLLAVWFGVWGASMVWMKHSTLAGQAEQFARDYIEVVARDDAELALELRKTAHNRFPPTMPLKAHYQLNPQSEEALVQFRQDGINATIRRAGPGHEWVRAAPVRVFTHYGMQQVEVVLADGRGEGATEVLVVLEYRVDSKGNGQWHVVRAIQNTDVIYAPSIL